MPLVDPVLVLADEADDVVELRELCTLARRVGTPVIVRCAHRRAAGELIHIARDHRPRAILITSSPVNDRISAEVAVGLEAAIVTDVTGLSFDDDQLVAISDRVSSEIHTQTAVITVRPRTHKPQRESMLTEADVVVTGGRGSMLTEADVVVAGRRGLMPTGADVVVAGGRGLTLTEADVVVAGGRGVGSAAGFSLLARVAYALGGCLGGTHTAGELGWCPRHARISLPGTQIRPRLYLAGGVSGSVRHRSAIRGAQTVVAIDSDPAAPILREADFGIVGDLHQILPALLDELAARAARSPASAPPAPSPESALTGPSPATAYRDSPPESASPESSPPAASAAPSPEGALAGPSPMSASQGSPRESTSPESSPPAASADPSQESALSVTSTSELAEA